MQSSHFAHQCHVYTFLAQHQAPPSLCAVCPSLFITSSYPPWQLHHAPVARELASTQMLSSGPSTHHFPCMGSSWRTLATTSVIIVVNRTSVTLSFQPFIMSAALLLIIAANTLSYLTTGKCPTSFPQNENTLRLVRTHGMLGTSLPLQRGNTPSPNEHPWYDSKQSDSEVPGEYRAPFHCHYSQVHSGPKW